jgi:hypothetical protein
MKLAPRTVGSGVLVQGEGRVAGCCDERVAHKLRRRPGGKALAEVHGLRVEEMQRKEMRRNREINQDGQQ